MRLYRFAPTEFADDLTGTGGLFSAGRWHRKGTRILYTSDCVSLAKLELLANSTLLPVDPCLITLETPDTATCLSVDAKMLPENWSKIPYIPELAIMAEQWIREGKFWVMRVPSVHSPVEFNYLLNPLHPDHRTIQLVSIEPHSFDDRLK